VKRFNYELPGMSEIRTRFIDLLAERREQIASHTVAAWDAKNPDDIKTNLAAAQATLHQIAGTAGSLGFGPLGDTARACEIRIIKHLEDNDGRSLTCPGDLIVELDEFVVQCRAVSHPS
jgi:chemotaxis protein histidine kinase CheA